ncbi:MAG: 3-oxoacyl-[acyl-carrier-protein] reductase [Bacteroidetes bacterium]|nr:MAG: 3-oxoacyl-[acyl-carrier-protein] reductase [Bacteroidota bacterium]PIE88138.1 MAG: 3-oxoacyl-[acyl-carrier-protein] reductase [Bacteroidota bacterium]
MNLLKGKTALVTGASRGIGRAIALCFAENGADVAFTDLRLDEHSEQLERAIASLGCKGKAYASNAADMADSIATVEAVIKEFGRIDILVNNAGITRDKLMLRMSEEDWDMVINVNLKSAFNLTKAVQRYMIKQQGGSIINMSSVVGVSGNGGQANYAASKAGLIGFTKSIAQELGSRNVRCNAIAPGFIETEMTHKLSDEVREDWVKQIPLRRAGLPKDVADVATFLASDLSAYVTGQVLQVCGGMNT